MPEEIADLTGKRVEDTAYANNVVFDANGLNELLENIKDYPIVDIDYVDEHDEDEISHKNVWETYTSGTPCIKVIYGDEDNLNGNLSTTDMDEIRAAKKRIALHNSVCNLYDKYGSLEQEYLTLIRNVQQELKSIIINVCNTYNKYLTKNNDGNWVGSYYTLFNNAGQGPNETAQTDFKKFIGGNQGVDGLYYKISFSVNNLADDYLPDIIAGTISETSFYEITYGVRGADPINPAVTDSSLNYYVNPIMGKVNGVNDDDVTAISNITWTDVSGSNLRTYLSSKTWNVDSLQGKLGQYNNLLQQTIDLLVTGEGTGHVKQLLLKYAGYIRNARVQQMEAIRQYLKVKNGVTDEALNEEVVEYSMEANTPYKNVYDYVMENYILKSTQEDEDFIISTMENATDNKYTKVEATSTYNSSTTYYVIDNGRYKNAAITSNNFVQYRDGEGLYTLNSGEAPAIYGYKYVKVGSNIEWDENQVSSSTYTITSGMEFPEVDPETTQRNGHFRITINGHTYEIGIKGLECSSTTTGRLSVGQDNTTAYLLPADNSTDSRLGTSAHPWTTACINGLKPSEANTGSIGSTTAPYGNAYITIVQPSSTSGSSVGTFGTPYASGYFSILQPSQSSGSSIGTSGTPYDIGYFNQIKIGSVTIGGNNNTGDKTKFLRGDGNWSNTLEGPLTLSSATGSQLIVSSTANAVTPDNTTSSSYSSSSAAAISTQGGVFAAKDIWGRRVFNAVFNDYAEYRRTCPEAKPGMCVVDNDDGTMRVSDGYLLPGAQIVSDTFGHAMGMTEECTTPVAVAGRVLAYPYQDRKNYHAGMAVCAAPGGKVNIMSRKDIREYPDCIVGIVSEIPDYEYWGTDNVKVDGRIWIKVR